MADPYATEAPDLSGRPTGPPPWEGAVGERGGVAIGVAASAPEARFRFVACSGAGTLPPLARLEPAMAVLLWLEHGGERSAAAANRLLGELRAAEEPIYAIKHGWVGGPPQRPGCFEIDAALVLTVLDEALVGGVDWEADPDFGYEVAADVPGVEGEAARALLPRLLYGDHDRSYEHASLVAARKRERAALAASLPGLAPVVAAAAGWPPSPTGDAWRD